MSTTRSFIKQAALRPRRALALMMALALLASLFPGAIAEMAPAADTFEQEAQQFLAQQASEELPADLTVGYLASSAGDIIPV